MFKQQRIQLPTEDEQPLRPAIAKRSSSSWSIPCCSNLSIRGQRIQLPEDSDSEEEQQQPQEFIIPPPHHQATPFNIDFTAGSGSGNAFLQHASTSNLSRNPFARAPEEDHQKSIQREEVAVVTEEEEQPKQVFEQMQQEDTEELADFSRSAALSKYANEPDWTEMYQDESEAEEEPSSAAAAGEGYHITAEEQEETTPTTEEEQSTFSKNTQEEEQDAEELSIVDTHITTDNEEEEKEEEKIPQIEEEVLKLLPLPQLSNEMPSTLIHKKLSFEKSMYGEQPLMSTTSLRASNTAGTRFSRFSMTEEDFLALKKQEEEEQAKKEQVAKTVIEPFVVEQPQKEVKVIEVAKEDPLLAEIEINAKEIIPPAAEATEVTQQQDQRRSSIVTTAAQSILGDKLDDFTEKLAFIKKNIIMSIDSDDEEDEEIDNAEETLKKIALLKQQEQQQQQKRSPVVIPNSDDQQQPKRSINQHRRTSSLMDVAPTLARFMNTISGNQEGVEKTPTPTSSTTSTTSFSPSSLFSALAGPMPEPSSSKLKSNNTPSTTQDRQARDEEPEEELFDFTKVIEIGKNMKTFSEGFVGNGIRMFNDVATRVKTELQQEEEKMKAANRAHQKQEEAQEEVDEASNWLNDSYI